MQQKKPLTDFSAFPRFDEIKPEHVLPALKTLLQRNRETIARLTKQPGHLQWAELVDVLDADDDELERLWSPVSHLSAVMDSKALRQVYDEALPLLSDYATEVGQNRDLYDAFQYLNTSPEALDFSVAQKTSLAHQLRDFKLSGIELEGEAKQRLKTLNQELSQLSNQFNKNVLDATEAWHLDVTDKVDLAGMPESAMAAARETAKQAGHDGWRFNLHAPSFIPVMTYADKRDYRRQMYTAYVTRASEQAKLALADASQWDNTPVMQAMLAKRAELAKLLGYVDYAEYSLVPKMAQSAEEVEQFLLELAQRSRKPAQLELAEVLDFAHRQDGLETIEAWDLSYYSEQLKQQRYDFSSEAVRLYFPLSKVLKGLFTVVERVFGMRVLETERPAVWHNDVQFYKICDTAGELRGYFYLDLFARNGKRGGAWMADCIGRRQTSEETQHPVAFLTTNFMAPIGEQDAVLTHDDVTTLFHEFGHGLHHLLTQVDVPSVAGINGVPWDAVELPSQFLENWCWQPEALTLISGHFETGEPLPQAMLDKMLAAKNFQSALQMIRQIEFALFDIRLHRISDPGDAFDIEALLQSVRDEVSVVKPPEFNRFANSFTHIFSGGYAAGYYSYKWAEVLSADAFSRFEQEGIFDQAVGQDFLRCILEKGGSEEPMALFTQFRGREPSIDALLVHSGLADGANAQV